MTNPRTDDLGSRMFQNKNRKPTRTHTQRNTDKILAAPTETFEERTNREQMTSWLYGSQTEPEVWREGRRIK